MKIRTFVAAFAVKKCGKYEWGKIAWRFEMKIRTFVAAFAVKKCGKYEWGKIAGAKRFSNKNNTKKR